MNHAAILSLMGDLTAQIGGLTAELVAEQEAHARTRQLLEEAKQVDSSDG